MKLRDCGNREHKTIVNGNRHPNHRHLLYQSLPRQFTKRRFGIDAEHCALLGVTSG